MKKFLLSLLFFTSLQAAPVTHNVTNNSGNVATVGSLPYFMSVAAPGDTIDCTQIGGSTITLLQSLPAVNGLTITGGTAGSVTIDGNSFQAFAAGNGAIVFQNFIIQGGISEGSPGGTGVSGGGGGTGAGGGLYVHSGSNVVITNVQFTGCSAVGGAGGDGIAAVGCGGGGGGYNDSTGSGVGGAGDVAGGGGGGGGGNTSAGAGGAGDVVGINGALFGGAGGGGGIAGKAGGNTTPPRFGGALSGANGGGGAGLSANGGAASGTTGGVGGAGIGGNAGFAGGGGGAGASGGAGTGTGGGGGANVGGTIGGAGGVDGGGGGGGITTGGKGGFGAGGGGGGTTGGGTVYGGGTGGVGSPTGGGGGSGLGGTIFVQNNALLTIGEGLTIAGSSVLPGAAGAGGGSGGAALGTDIFLRSGGGLIFNNSVTDLMLLQPIISDLNGGGGGTGGGIQMSGSKTVILQPNNSYTGSTNFNAGTIQVPDDTALGATSPVTGLVFAGGALQTTSSFTLTPARTVTLNGSGNFNVNSGTTFRIDNSTNPIAGVGGLIKSGAGTLELFGTGANTYSGGTTISNGILETAADTYLGAAAGGITFNGGTLQMAAGYAASARTIHLSGSGTIDFAEPTVTLSGVISGGGALTVMGGTLVLTGANTLSGTTTISTGTLQGSSDNLTKGNIFDSAGAFLVFDQPANGTYGGQVSGGGTFTKQGAGALTLTGNSSGFMGPVNVTAGQLLVNGALAGSTLMSSAGTTIGGTGTFAIANSTINGFLRPGNNATGTLTFVGDLTLAGELDIEISPTQADFLSVSGTLTRGGALVIDPLPGFYGFGRNYPIIQAGLLAGSFSSTSSTDPNFVLTVETIGNTMYVDMRVLSPFLGFPAANGNIQSVVNNLNALGATGAVALDSPLAVAIDSLVGLSNAAINDALDQLHPAIFSGYYDLQAEVGSQIIAFFHRRPAPICGCNDCGQARAWIEPYGNWLDLQDVGIEVGFNAYSKGLAAGIDWQFADYFVGGIGGAWNHTELRWHGERGHSDVDGFFGGAYLDYTTDSFYLGTAFLAGRDFFNTFRKLTFSTVNEDARGDYEGLDLLGQLSTAYFLGPDKCCFLPYFNFDVFYLKQQAFTEKNAPGLNLDVRSNAGATMRSELGVGLQVIDRNRNETMCVSPQVSMGWTCIAPLFRQAYTANFEGYAIPFKVEGWNHTWHLLTMRFGLSLTYTCYTLLGEYLFELAPQHGTPLFDQRANIRLEFNW